MDEFFHMESTTKERFWSALSPVTAIAFLKVERKTLCSPTALKPTKWGGVFFLLIRWSDATQTQRLGYLASGYMSNSYMSSQSEWSTFPLELVERGRHFQMVTWWGIILWQYLSARSLHSLHRGETYTFRQSIFDSVNPVW